MLAMNAHPLAWHPSMLACASRRTDLLGSSTAKGSNVVTSVALVKKLVSLIERIFTRLVLELTARSRIPLFIAWESVIATGFSPDQYAADFSAFSSIGRGMLIERSAIAETEIMKMMPKSTAAEIRVFLEDAECSTAAACSATDGYRSEVVNNCYSSQARILRRLDERKSTGACQLGKNYVHAPLLHTPLEHSELFTHLPPFAVAMHLLLVQTPEQH
jgi:hypothetical protein